MKSDGIHLTGIDLIAGEQVEFRQVVVRVRFPDGKPMKTASVRVVGASIREGESPWIGQRGMLEKDSGTARFAAPANRRLRIEIEDERVT